VGLTISLEQDLRREIFVKKTDCYEPIFKMFKELDDVIKQGGKTALGTNPPLCILFFHFLLIYFSVDSFLFSPVAAKQAQEAKKRLFQAVLSSSDELFHASFYDNLLQVDQSQVLLDVCAPFSFSLLFFFFFFFFFFF